MTRGGPLVPGNERLAELERLVREQQKRIDTLESRLAQRAEFQQVKIAKTTSQTVYPTVGNSFEFIVQDANHPRIQGSQIATFQDLDGTVQDVGYALGSRYIPDGTAVLAIRLRNADGKWRWWLMDPSPTDPGSGSGSGSGSESGSAENCIEVLVPPLTFDPLTCVLTTCVRTICLPADATIGPVSCGSGST